MGLWNANIATALAADTVDALCCGKRFFVRPGSSTFGQHWHDDVHLAALDRLCDHLICSMCGQYVIKEIKVACLSSLCTRCPALHEEFSECVRTACGFDLAARAFETGCLQELISNVLQVVIYGFRPVHRWRLRKIPGIPAGIPPSVHGCCLPDLISGTQRIC